MKLPLRAICLLVLLLRSDAATAEDAAASPPHMPRQGANLIVNPSVKTKANWSFLRDAEYDASTSRTNDGSGSMKLKTPLPSASMALTDLIAVQPGKRFTYGFYFKTLNGPTYVGAQISLHDSNRKFIRNHASGLGGTSLAWFRPATTDRSSCTPTTKSSRKSFLR